MRHVDPRFPTLLRQLRTGQGLSLRELATRVPCSHVHVWELENGRKRPSPELAARLDLILNAARALSDLAAGPAEDRLEWVTARPRSLDVATVNTLAGMLASQRRLEDAIGSAPILPAVTAQLDTVTHLVRNAPDGKVRRQLMDVAGQWAQFAAWLSETTTDHQAAAARYTLAMEWAAEAANPDLVATVLSMRGHMAWVCGRPDTTVQLSRAAQWPPAGAAVRAGAVQQEARGLAMLGDGRGADDRLAEGRALAAEAAATDPPDWLYFYDPTFFELQAALVDQYLGRNERAAEALSAGLAKLPPALQGSDWIGWYVMQLARSLHEIGDQDGAADALDRARQIAESTTAARLRGEVETLARAVS